MRRVRFILILAIIHSYSCICFSQELDEIDTTYKGNILPTPSFTYSPETDVVLGVFLLWQFKVPEATYGTRPSYALFYAASSFKGQQFFELSELIYTNHEKYFVEGIIESKIFNEQYFGIGPNTIDADQLKVEYTSLQIRQRILRRVIPDLFIGPQYRLIRTTDVSWKNVEDSTTTAPDVNGNMGSTESGLGISINYDKRNSALTPTEDFYIEFNAYAYGNYLGGDFNYGDIKLDARRYIDFNTRGKHVLAFQGVINILTGEQPFREFGKIGGRIIGRGYLEGRYRDDFAVQLQTEYRINLFWRIGMTAFGSVGQVSGSEPFSFSGMKYSGGMGFRFNINRKDTANARLDIGFADGFEGIYIGFGEVF